MKKKITITKHKTITENVVRSIICDWCGEEYSETDAITSFYIDFGFGSKYDGYTFLFDICDECFDKYLKDKACEIEDDIGYFND